MFLGPKKIVDNETLDSAIEERCQPRWSSERYDALFVFGDALYFSFRSKRRKISIVLLPMPWASFWAKKATNQASGQVGLWWRHKSREKLEMSTEGN